MSRSTTDEDSHVPDVVQAGRFEVVSEFTYPRAGDGRDYTERIVRGSFGFGPDGLMHFEMRRPDRTLALNIILSDDGTVTIRLHPAAPHGD